jgi:molybdopterin-containing oxidoreductase family iron-sulfur binding subunit
MSESRDVAEKTGPPEHWRTLGERAGSKDFQEALRDEFADGAAEWKHDPQGRRHFIKIMGAAGALATLAGGCYTRDEEHIVPYVEQPENVVPGNADFYATSFPLGGYAQGVLVESQQGRPTKIEGNPSHPASLGSTSTFMQASVLDLYDPDRSDTFLDEGVPSTWQDFVAAVQTRRRQWRQSGGRSLRVLTGPVTSPTLAAQLRALLAEFPEARWHVHAPVAAPERGDAGDGNAGSPPPKPVYHFDRAEVMLSLEGDFFQYGPASVRYARDFAEGRRVRSRETEMSRLYAAESSPTLMGAQADHRLPLPPRKLGALAREVARRLGASVPAGADGNTAPNWTAREQHWIDSVASDLQGAGSEALVVAGSTQPPVMQALARAMNEALDAPGTTVEQVPSPEARPPTAGEENGLRALTDAMQRGDATDVIVLGVNPAYTAPADIPFAEALGQVPFSAHLSTHRDATSRQCQWHVPRTHFLEAWGDARAFDGTASVQQPLIAPLYDACRSAHQVVAALQGAPGQTGYDLVRRYWQRRSGGGNFEQFWEKVLYRGVVPGTGLEDDGRSKSTRTARGMTQGPSRSLPAQRTGDGDASERQRTAPADTSSGGSAAAASSAAATGGMAAAPAAGGGGGPQQRPDEGGSALGGQLLQMSGGASRSHRDTTPRPPASGDTAAAGTAASSPDTTSQSEPRTTTSEQASGRSTNLTLLLRPDPSIRDGRFANNAWLQELPKPLTKLTWGNAALMSPATAEERSIETGDVVRLAYRGRTLDVPAMKMPGHADGCVTLRLGYGRPHAGYVGSEATLYQTHEEDEIDVTSSVGANAYRLRTADAPWGGPGLSMEKTGETEPLATTQHHQSMEGRELIRAATIETFRENPEYAHEGHAEHLPSLYPDYDYDADGEGPYEEESAPPLYPQDEAGDEYDHNYSWGMVIDQNVCTGCNACVTACQSENNIPVVGKEQVLHGREMHWLRIDRYYSGTPSDPETRFQPVPCMHCEKAPCEVVCPVAATVHDAEGLNVMVYNRCIGTRYCSNNCPYKVRRFNFLQWSDWDTDSLELMRNPDVTVRSRGVMEKCTYCIQRISAARIDAKTENRTIRDGEMLTACQQACPTEAISFGDLNDEDAEVTQLKEQPHNYALLGHLGTRPRTTYLTHLSNPNEGLIEEEENEIRQQGLDPEV